MADKTLWFVNSGGVQALTFSTRSGVQALKLHDSCPSLTGLGVIFSQETFNRTIIENAVVPLWVESTLTPPIASTFSGFAGIRRSTPNEFWWVGRAAAPTTTMRAFRFDGSIWTEYSTGMAVKVGGIVPFGAYHAHFVFPDRVTPDRPVIWTKSFTPNVHQIQRWDGSSWQLLYETAIPINYQYYNSYYSPTIFCHVQGTAAGGLRGYSDGIDFEFFKSTPLGLELEAKTGDYTSINVLSQTISTRGYSEIALFYSYNRAAGGSRMGYAICRITGATSINISGPHAEFVNSYPPKSIVWFDYINGNYWGIRATGGYLEYHLYNLTTNTEYPIDGNNVGELAVKNRYIFITDVGENMIFDTQTAALVPNTDYTIGTQAMSYYADTPHD